MKDILRPSRWSVAAGAGLVALLGVLAAVGPAPARAPEREKLVTFKTSVVPADPFSDQNAAPDGTKPAFRRGETFLLRIEGTPKEGWHTYPVNKKAPDQTSLPSTLRLKGPAEVVDLWPVEESEPKLVPEEGGQAYEYDGPFTWTVELLVRDKAPPGPLNLEVEVELQVCAKTCVMERQTLTVPITVSDKPPLKLSPEVAKKLAEFDEARAQAEKKLQEAAAARTSANGSRTGQSPSSPTPSAGTPTAGSPFSWQELRVVDRTGGEDGGGPAQTAGLWGTIVTAVLGGFISLLTPCVFPMIPVTVSFFLKQAEHKGHRALTMASVYCATIVLVLTVGGMALVRVLQVVSQHYATNIFLTVVFVFFALSLLGMYEITLPSGLANLTGSREGKGGLAGIVFMALTFSIISFACVGPIYGGFITLEASQSSAFTGWVQRFAGPFAFALAFASPFFVLALFPSLLRSLPRSGSWMNSVKVVMGFLELAAAFKFVRAAELNLRARTDYFSFDLVLGIYVALCVACGLYLLNVYRLPHDHEADGSIGVPRLIFGLVFLSFALYLLPGMFKEGNKDRAQKPRGVAYEWVSSFLLPDDRSDWSADLASALALAEREKKPLFIDFTGLG